MQGRREGSRVTGVLVPVLGRGLTLTYSAPLDTARQSTHTPPQQAENHKTVVVGVRLVNSRKVVSRDAHRLPSELSGSGTKGSYLAGPVCGSIAVPTTGCGKIGWGVPRG